MSRRAAVSPKHELLLSYLGGPQTLPLLKEEIWRDIHGVVTRYSLAYIDPQFYSGDNGRVLGYDNAHGHHHRHYCGAVTAVKYTSFARLLRQFEREVREIRR